MWRAVSEETDMTKTICLFNHKGGVSKTTTTFNLGWVLADMGNTVLIVDLDSQCNLTGLVLGYNAIDDDHMAGFYESRAHLTMRPIVSALIDGIPPEQFVDQDKGQVIPTAHKRLFLLPGHLDTSELDSQISVSLKIATGIPVTRNIPGSLPKALQLISDKVGADYTLYDLSPNIGGLNQAILMSSDFFIVPTSPDYFCLQAVSSLEKTIPKWHDEIEYFKKVNRFDSRTYPIKNKPKFLGTIQQRYRPRYDKPGKSFQNWIDTIRGAINGKLIPALEKIDCVIHRDVIQKVLHGSDLAPYDLAHISNFNSLIAISQQLSKPIFALSDAEIHDTGKVFGYAEATMKESRNKFMEVFRDLGERIVALTD